MADNPADSAPLPPLPSANQDPWFTARDNWDDEVTRRLEGYLSPAELSAKIGDAVLPDAFLDATTRPDGTPSQMDTGQAITSFGNSPAVVEGGRIVHHPTTALNRASYWQVDLGSAVTEAGFTVEWSDPGSNAQGEAAIVLPLAPWAPGSLSLAGIHLVIKGDGTWRISTWTGTAETPVYYSGKLRFVPTPGVIYPVSVTLDRAASVAYVNLPDGDSVRVTHPNVAAATSTYVIWELYEYNSPYQVPAKLAALWARGSAQPQSRLAGVTSSDLALFMSEARARTLPHATEVIAEPSGTTSSNILSTRVELARRTIKRPTSGKVLVELSLMAGINAPNVILLAWFGYVAKGAASASGDFTKAAQFAQLPQKDRDGSTDSTHVLNETWTPRTVLSIPPATQIGVSDEVDVIACVVRFNGSDGNAKYRISDAGGQRVLLTVQECD